MKLLNLKDQVWRQVSNQVRDQVRNQVRYQVHIQVYLQNWDRIRRGICDQVINQLLEDLQK